MDTVIIMTPVVRRLERYGVLSAALADNVWFSQSSTAPIRTYYDTDSSELGCGLASAGAFLLKAQPS